MQRKKTYGEVLEGEGRARGLEILRQVPFFLILFVASLIHTHITVALMVWWRYVIAVTICTAWFLRLLLRILELEMDAANAAAASAAAQHNPGTSQ